MSFNPNNNFTPNPAPWSNIGGAHAQIVGGTGTTSSNNGGNTLSHI